MHEDSELLFVIMVDVLQKYYDDIPRGSFYTIGIMMDSALFTENMAKLRTMRNTKYGQT